MNIKQVLSLAPNTKVKDSEFGDIYIVLGDEDTRFLTDESGRGIVELYTLQTILDMEFEEYDERPKYDFYNCLHLDKQSPCGVKVCVKYVLESYTIKAYDPLAQLGLYYDDLRIFYDFKIAIKILNCLLNEEDFKDALSNNENFMVEENK